MSGYGTAVVTNRLPDDGGLRTAAQYFKNVTSTLAGRSSAVRSAADTITPAVWADSSSGRVRSMLYGLADELKAGAGAMNDAADALDRLAAYVKAKRSTYDSVGKQLANLPHTVPAGGDYMTSLLHLNGQRQSIERDVQGAMAEAAATINASAAKASRFQYKASQSVWSHIEDFAHGLWDGTAGAALSIGRLLLGSAEVQAKLSPERAILDPRGFEHDLKHFTSSIEGYISATASHPGHFVSSLLNLDELKKNPARWAGALVPNILLAALTDGGGEAAEGANAAKVSTREASLGGISDIGRLAIEFAHKLETLDEQVSGPWVIGNKDYQVFTSVIQKTPRSCVSACAEMLTGTYSQDQFLQFFGDRTVKLPELAALMNKVDHRHWQVIVGPDVSDILSSLREGPIGAGLAINASDKYGHMVVIEQLINGDLLVRDPYPPGLSYTVNVNWLDKWVKGVIVHE